ncbi:hypothetical protein [Burkholderia multivorans]|uniref:hypothetical protein n=1 Tax=Burkholderia multivorans TaxID=87883 RepID=UPI0020B2AB07|nr:hypothetical protein [Burkholderia multivorans]
MRKTLLRGESVLDRTRRFFYVCCSRAVKDLAVVVMFVPDVDQARAAIERANIFPAGAIHGLEDIDGWA